MRGSKRKEGAAYTIAGECERLFCGALRAAFSGSLEGQMVMQNDNRVVAAARRSSRGSEASSYGSQAGFGEDLVLRSPVLEPIATGGVKEGNTIEQFFEVFNYAGGGTFRGFTASDEKGMRSMFVFFEEEKLGHDLKPRYVMNCDSDKSSTLMVSRSSLMALLELCDVSEFHCSQMIVCVDRTLEDNDAKGLLRSLGWVGFEPYTLADWMRSHEVLSERWMFLNMEI